MLLAIALVAVLGPSLTNVVLALSSIGWVGYARVVRAQVLQAREFEYVSAARALGAATPRILLRHILPAALPALIVQATLGMGGAILSEAALSFLGLGVQPPTPSWGAMLNYGRAHVLDAPHLTIFPGLAIAVLVLGLNLLGDSLRDRSLTSELADSLSRPRVLELGLGFLRSIEVTEPRGCRGEVCKGDRLDWETARLRAGARTRRPQGFRTAEAPGHTS